MSDREVHHSAESVLAAEAFDMLLEVPRNRRTERFDEVVRWLREKFDPAHIDGLEVPDA